MKPPKARVFKARGSQLWIARCGEIGFGYYRWEEAIRTALKLRPGHDRRLCRFRCPVPVFPAADMILCLIDTAPDANDYPQLYRLLRIRKTREFRQAMREHRLMPGVIPIYARTRFEDTGWWPASYAVYAVERGGLFIVKWSNLVRSHHEQE